MARLFIALLSVPFTLGNAITAAPEFRRDLLRRQTTSASDLCGPWLYLENSCAAASPSFSLLTAFASQAECLCYSSSTWVPNLYDAALSTCLSYLSTASPVYYTSIDGPDLPRAPCEQVSSIVGPGANGITSGSAQTSTIDPNYAACESWQSISSSCDATISGFASLPISAEDKCLCYTSGTYAPSIFDGYWASCLTYFSTASPAIYTSLGGDGGVRSPCAFYQPTVTGPISTSTGTASSSTASGATASTGAVVTTSPPSSTSIPLTTTLATTAASGSGAFHIVGGFSLIELLVPMILVAIFQH